MRNNYLSGTLLSITLLLSGCNYPNYQLINQEQDNKNSLSTKTFIQSSVSNIFSEYDTNKNNFIELSELSGASESFKKMDKNNDGKLTIAEVQPPAERIDQISGMINKFYEDLYQKVNSENDKTSAQNTSEVLETFKETDEWNKAINEISTFSNGKKVINHEQFSSAMNNFFLNLSKKPEISTSSIWSRIKDIFKKGENIPAVNSKPPVILVQGYAEPSWYFMYGIYRNLKKSGRQVFPVNLFPNIGDIREQAKIVANKIEQVKKEQNISKIDYVAHSMGGLIGRYYIQDMGGSDSIDHFVSIATPHYGTYLAWLGIGEAAKQMKPGSDFLAELNRENPIRKGIKYTSIWTKTDEIVLPSSNSVLQGSTVMPNVNFVGHLLILWAPRTYTQITEALDN